MMAALQSRAEGRLSDAICIGILLIESVILVGNIKQVLYLSCDGMIWCITQLYRTA